MLAFRFKPEVKLGAQIMRTLSITTASLLFTLAAYADGNMELVSLATGGVSGHGDSHESTISADGRFVAFASIADDLILGDTNGAFDVFVRDMQLGVTERVSVSSLGVESDGASERPDISADGRFVVFESTASNLVSTPDLNGLRDIYVHDRQTGQTRRVSTTIAAIDTDGASTDAAISADGAVIAFRSEATNLIAGDLNGVADVFVEDSALSTLVRVSVSSAGAEANAFSGQLLGVDVSGDGRFVAFASFATNLVPGDLNASSDIFVRDRLNSTTERVSLTNAGAEADWTSRSATISDDGNIVAFDSAATNLVAGDLNASPDCFVRDRAAGTTTIISIAEDDTQGSSFSRGPMVSGDGNVVCFESFASELVPDDTNGVLDAFRYHIPSGELVRLSVGPTGQGDGSSSWVRPTYDGSLSVMVTAATNFDIADLGPGFDVYLVSPSGGGNTGTVFCTSSDSIGCPCANPGGADEGCANGTGLGALLSGSGIASAGASTLVLSGDQLIPSQPGLYFQGNNQVAGGQGIQFGDGLRCAGGGVIRLQVRFSSAAGQSETSIDLGAAGGVSAGDIRRYQVWYRDPAGSPCGALFNLSNGLEIVWGL